MFKRRLIFILTIFPILFLGIQIIVGQTRKTTTELLSLPIGSLITDVVKTFGNPDKSDDYGSNYRYLTYEIDKTKSYVLSFSPKGKLFQFTIIQGNEREILFYDEQYKPSDNDTRDKKLFYAPFNQNLSKVFETFGKPDIFNKDDNYIITYKLSDQNSLNLFFTGNEKLWKVQYNANGEETISRFDKRIFEGTL